MEHQYGALQKPGLHLACNSGAPMVSNFFLGVCVGVLDEMANMP